ncbi:dephospho-CoA kinase [Prochlorococcus sp. MIT 1341]|uniref:dephospho-CoA kinase n=1 Tax=Prochlorococcus sp. MIT 1341 TaxID=3096221 RepID=UPI002A75C681|nr:dephospho-CoA kinase [Prochlorococcus sp. MIT 1341]
MNRVFSGGIHSPRWQGPQRRIGLTGGIATGKSSVSSFLEKHYGFPVLDADVFSRKALGPDTPLTQAVFERYGKDVLDTTKFNSLTLDRFALAQIIFSNVDERLWLEGLVHPFIRTCFEEQLRIRVDSPIVVLMIPLLFEASFTDLCSEVWLVTCTKKQQASRLSGRDHLSLVEAYERINTQWPLDKKKSLSESIIDNSGDPNAWVSTLKSLVSL